MINNKSIKLLFLISIIVLFTMLNQYLNGQSPCKNYPIRTNPNGSTCDQTNDTTSYNTEKPNKRNCNPTIFDWTQEWFNLNSNVVLPNLDGRIRSPFYQDDNLLTNHFLNNRDSYSSLGWELIKQDFGYYDNGLPNTVGHPYFILYNKFTGIIRVFIAVGRLEDYNGIKLQIKHVKTDDNIETNLLNESENTKPLRCVNDYQENVIVSSVTSFLNESEKWFYADFRTNYDPCVCYFKSKLVIDVYLIQEASINLEGTSEGTITTITNRQGTVNTTNKNTSFGDLVNAGKKAVETYKTYNNAKNEALTTVDGWIENGLKTQSEGDDLKSGILKTLDMFAGKNSFVRSIASLAGPIGAAFSIYDAFTMVSGNNKQEMTIPPLAIRTTIKMQGSLIASNLYKTITFYTPGSDNLSLNDEDYPYYNQPLGVFNLLKTPIMEYHNNRILEYWPKDPFTPLPIPMTDELRFCLHEDLTFVINSALGLKTDADDMDILVAIIFEFDDVPPRFNTTSYWDDVIIKDTPKNWRTRFVPIECASQLKIIFRSDEYYWMSREVQPPDIPIPKVYLKVIANLKRQENNPNARDILYVGKYPVQMYTVEEGANWELQWQSIYRDIPKSIDLNNTTITSDLKAWEAIRIGENVTVQGGPYNLIAEKIINNGTSIIEPNIILESGLPAICSNSKYGPESRESLSLFCHSNFPDNYQPENRSNNKISKNENLDVSDNSRIIQVFPNPTSNNLSIKFNIANDEKIELYIINTLGNKIINIIDNAPFYNGYYNKNLSIEDLPNGVYFVNLKTDNGVFVKKFVVIK